MTRDEQILSLEKSVRFQAGRAKRMLPSNIAYADLLGPGWEGAIKAVDNYDGRPDCTLASYAERKIWGHILDYLRSLDPLSRKHRKDIKAGLEDAPQIIDIDYLVNISRATDPRGNYFVDAAMAHKDVTAILEDVNLTPNERTCITRYYFEDGISMKEIAAAIPCNESRVSQLIKSAKRKMRMAIGLPVPVPVPKVRKRRQIPAMRQSEVLAARAS